jgi:hypothetical protein
MGLGYNGVGSGADAGRARRTSISSTARSTQAGLGYESKSRG